MHDSSETCPIHGPLFLIFVVFTTNSTSERVSYDFEHYVNCAVRINESFLLICVYEMLLDISSTVIFPHVRAYLLSAIKPREEFFFFFWIKIYSILHSLRINVFLSVVPKYKNKTLCNRMYNSCDFLRVIINNIMHRIFYMTRSIKLSFQSCWIQRGSQILSQSM